MRRPNPGDNPNNLTPAQRRVANSQFLQPGVGGASSRQNRYGTANPYANSTSNNPYVGIAWLGSGFPHPLPEPPPGVPEEPAFRPLQYAASRPSYDLAGIAALLGPYWHVPIRVDYAVLAKIRETIPMISAAIMRLKELVGWPEVMAAPNLKMELDEWLRTLPVLRVATGGPAWMRAHLDNMMTYGRAHSEVVLNAARNDVHGLVEVHPTTLGIRPTFGGYAVNVVQYQYGGGVPVTLLPELLLGSVYDIRGDDPNGTSIIAELPFVSQILNAMLRGLGNTWTRFGDPIWWINWEPPEGWDDPTGRQTDQILGEMQGNLQNLLQARAEGKTGDFFTQGKVTVQIMGAEGEQLRFEESGRAIMEQICARFGLPPFMYGFSWSSTERMSTAQAKMVTEIIESFRETVTPAIERLINLRMLITGKRGKISLRWPKVSMQDLLDVSRSELMDAQAESTKLSNWSIKVQSGINSMEEMAQEFRDDLDDLTPEQVRKRLPDLATEPPVIAPPQKPGGEGGPGQDAGNPRTESEGGRAYDLELLTNGRH
jgi:hypothetical protein